MRHWWGNNSSFGCKLVVSQWRREFDNGLSRHLLFLRWDHATYTGFILSRKTVFNSHPIFQHHFEHDIQSSPSCIHRYRDHKPLQWCVITGFVPLIPPLTAFVVQAIHFCSYFLFVVNWHMVKILQVMWTEWRFDNSWQQMKNWIPHHRFLSIYEVISDQIIKCLHKLLMFDAPSEKQAMLFFDYMGMNQGISWAFENNIYLSCCWTS